MGICRALRMPPTNLSALAKSGAWRYAMPMSPEEFGVKRQAILKHQSQVHDAPFRDPENDAIAAPNAEVSYV